MIQKELIVIFLQIYQPFISMKALFVAAVMVFYIIGTLKVKPYSIIKLNGVDLQSSILSLVSILLALFKYTISSEGQLQFYSIILDILLILSNLLFILNILELIVLEILTSNQKCKILLFRFLKYLKEKFPSLFSNLVIYQVKDPSRVY